MDVLLKMVITKVTRTHCARGSILCMKCKEEDSKPPAFALVKLFSYSESERPTMQYKGNWYGYEIQQQFKDESEAVFYSSTNGVELLE